MVSRDKMLDRLRGFSMIQVIIVHVLYWTGFFAYGNAAVVKSFFLFEMPLLFFVTGASNAYSKATGYGNFVFKRFWKILIPYWIYAVICIIIYLFSCGGAVPANNFAHLLISWFLPFNRQITSFSYMTWALWYIPVYLGIVLLMPFMLRLKETKLNWKAVFLFIALYIAACVFKFKQGQYILFFGMWTYIGMFYSNIKASIQEKKAQKYLLAVFAFSLVMLILAGKRGISLDMQNNKFPPNIIFMIYSFMIMSAIGLLLFPLDRIFRKISESSGISRKIFGQYEMHSLTVFLYQPFAFLTAIIITSYIPLPAVSAAEFLKAGICFVIAFLLCAGFSAIFSRFESVPLPEKLFSHSPKNKK